MRRTLLAAILSCASVPAAASGSFGVHLVTTADAPGAKAWRLVLPRGAVEEVFLEPAAILDETAIASADAARGPGGDGEIRFVLTPGGAQTLAEVTPRNVGGASVSWRPAGRARRPSSWRGSRTASSCSEG